VGRCALRQRRLSAQNYRFSQAYGRIVVLKLISKLR
jgi:hypothetical protein